MREILETLTDHLRRIAAEGGEFAPIDDVSMDILRRMASECSRKNSPKSPEGGGEIFEDNIDEVKFATLDDVYSAKKEREPIKRIKIVNNRTMDIKPIPAPSKFELPDGDKLQKWNALRDIVLSDAICAEHVRPTKKIVFGIGNLDADIFFCGEAPGADEEIQGEPFVGKAGQLLTKIIAAMGLSRNDVYIGNIMNWRPAGHNGWSRLPASG